MEDIETPCLPPYDPRLLGQGCASMGLSYYDLKVQIIFFSCCCWSLNTLKLY